MKPLNDISRRTFLRNAGILTIGFNILPSCRFSGNEVSAGSQNLSEGIDPARINSWLQIMEDGSIHVFTGKMELGQGIRIAIAQVAAEELNTEPAMVEVHLAETGVTADEGYTAGSRSIEQSAMAVRNATSAAAEILINTAGEKMNVTPEELFLDNGYVRDKAGKIKMQFSEVLEGKQITENIGSDYRPRKKRENRWVGKPVKRKDIPEMVIGKHIYVQDLRFPEMVHARMVRPAGYDRKLISWDENALRNAVSGILKLVVNGSFMGVITEDEYQAVQAKMHLERYAEWSDGRRLPDNMSLKEYIRNLPSETENVSEEGAIKFSGSSHKASYFRPYTMHGAIGPSCAVAIFDGNRLSIWSHSQGVYPLRRSISGLTGLTEDAIHITGIPGAGCYGHNGADDASADAALLAMAFPRRHIRLQWSRADEHGWEPYGSAMIMDLEAELDDKGKISSWKYDLWSDVHSTRPGGSPSNLLPGWFLKKPFDPPSGGYFGGASRNSQPYYHIPNQKITGHSFRGPLRVSALRGLGGYANVFAIECFMDELAEKAGMDPVEFRLAHLDDQRARDVLLKLTKKTGNETPAENTGIGYAFSRYKNEASYIAIAASVETRENERPKILKMWGVIDSGEVINPDGLINQTEGGMLQSASWMLKEAVRYDESQVISLDWYGYPILQYDEVPFLDVAIIDRPDEPPLGAGEAAQGPASAAIANAIYKASGKRFRDLPVSSMT